MNEITYHPIGVIHSEHTVQKNTPIQPVFADGCMGQAEIFPEYRDALRDLDGFSHIYLLYHFDRSSDVRLVVKPFMQDVERGLFATRAPCRPNHIGISIVRLAGIEKNVLQLENVDILDGTPLLDIKPYTAKFDCHNDVRSGWQDEIDENTARKRGKRDYNNLQQE